MPRLIGFLSGPTRGRGGGKSSAPSESKVLSLWENQAKNNTESGKWTDPKDIERFIAEKNLDNGPIEHQILAAKLRNTAISLEDRAQQVENARVKIMSDLKDELEQAQNSYHDDLPTLMSEYSEIYDRYLGNAKTYMDTVISKRNISIKPEDYIPLVDELEKKAMLYNQADIAMRREDDPELAQESLAGKVVVMNTDPGTGTVSRMDVIDRKDLKGSGYIETEIPINVGGKKIKAALNMEQTGIDGKGRPTYRTRLGNVELEATLGKPATGEGTQDAEEPAEFGIAKIVRKDDNFLPSVFGSKYDDIVTNGITLGGESSPQFSTSDFTPGRYLEREGELYQIGADNKLMRFAGKDFKEKVATAKAAAIKQGQDPKMVDLAVRPNATWLTAQKLSQDKIDEIDMNWPAPSAGSSLPPIESPSRAPAPQGEQYGPPVPQEFFAKRSQTPTPVPTNRVNTPDKPQAPKESSGGVSFVNDIVEKGKSFFRNLTA